MNLNKTKKITTQQKLIIWCMGFVITITTGCYFVIIPAISSIKNIKAEIITQKVNLEKKILKESGVSGLKEKIEKIEPQLNLFDQIFINKNRELEFITTLENIANKNNVSQKINLDPKNSQREHNYEKIPLSINAQGNFLTLLNYIKDLESVAYYINIQKLDFTKVSANARNQEEIPANNYNLIIMANTYWK